MSTMTKTILHMHIVHYLIYICIFIPKTVNSNKKVQCTWLVFLIKFLTLLIKKQQQKRKITAKILHNYNIHLECKDYKRALPYTRGHVILNPKLSDDLFRTLGVKNHIGNEDDSILIIPSSSKNSSEVIYSKCNYSVTVVFIRFI